MASKEELALRKRQLELELELAEAEDSPQPEADFLEQTGEKLGKMAKGAWETAKRVPSGVEKTLTMPDNEGLGQLGTALALEGLPGMPVVHELAANLMGAGGAAYGALMPGEDAAVSSKLAEDYYRKSRQDLLNQVDPDIRALANVGGMFMPAGLATTAAEAALPVAQKALDQGLTQDVGTDIAANLTAGLAVPVGVVGGVGLARGLKAVTPGKAISELPGRLRNVEKNAPGSLAEYYSNPEAVKAASLDRTAQGIQRSVEQIQAQRKDATARLSELDAQLKDVATDEVGIRKSLEDEMAKTSEEIKALDAEFKQTRMLDKLALEEQKGNLAENIRDEREARKGEVEEVRGATREAQREAMEGIQEAAAAHQEKLSKAAAEQAEIVDRSKVGIPITDIKRQFMEDMSTLGVPQKGPPKSVSGISGSVDYSPVSYQYRDAEVNRLLDIISQAPETMNATQLLNLRRMVGDAAYKAGAGEGKMQRTYQAMNDAITSVVGDRFPELRLEISTGIKSQEALDKLAGRAESTLSKLGGKGGLTAEQTLREIGAQPGVELPMDKIKAYLAMRQAEAALKRAPLPSSAASRQVNKQLQELRRMQAIETRPEVLADLKAAEQQLLKQDLDQYLQGLRSPIEAKKAGVESELSAIEGRSDLLVGDKTFKKAGDLEDFAADQARSAQIEGNTEWVKQLAKEQGRDVGEIITEMRQGRAKEAIYGQDAKPFGETSIGMGIMPAIRAGIKAAPAWVTTAPIDLRRKLSRAIGNAKWSTVLEKAFLRGGPKTVAAQHYLLQQSDPDYQKAMLEGTEETGQ
jgi:hypothetical protein